MPQTPTSRTAIWKTQSVLLHKMARVPGKIGFAVGLMLIMDIFGNYPYLFPIMVTGWLAMQACSKMVTGSADLKY